MTPPSLVLASASPRRRALLEQLGIPLRIDPPHLDERVLPGEAPGAYVLRLAREKAEAVHARHPGATVLAADTSVVLDGVVLGKPGSAEEALAMLRALRGRSHQVLTGVAVAGAGERLVTADVTFAAVTDAALGWYVSTGEPMDTAGAYAVQGIGGFLVERIAGSHSTVVGLPLVETLALLGEAGYILPWDRR
ncbi:MAG TPA: nucleoside triphosphate pyrophosphatase [Myxococcaceae bacterium]|nr:nucleoside triphosphate pyrophosphatase [Myxococcaceae bacterium]